MKNSQYTVGSYLASRLEQIGITHYFTVPGDLNVVLLDYLLKNPKLQMINCCSELNAGYAADGYARARGIAALVVTYSVGGLSALNAVASSYAEDLPVIVISGAPGTDTHMQNKIVHHGLGDADYTHVRDIYSHVTAQAVIIDHVHDAAYLIDQAIMTALRTKKPVYIEIPCNLVALTISTPHPLQYKVALTSDQKSLDAAVDHAASLLNSAKKPVLVGGVKLRSWQAIDQFQELIQASGYAVAAMPNAKGFISEQSPNYIGIYWGFASSPGCAEIVESSDAYLFAGPLFSDYMTGGYSMVLDPKKLINAQEDYIELSGQVYTAIALREFLSALAKRIKPHTRSLEVFKTIEDTSQLEEKSDPHGPLKIVQLFARIQELLDEHSALIIETGDSLFNSMFLSLPDGCTYESPMQYVTLGWSIGATLGYALARQNLYRVITITGDGGFQMNPQEVSSMIRHGLNPIIILVNNGGYTSEKVMEEGPYSKIKNWYYSELVAVFNAEQGNGWGCKVTTEAELIAAFAQAVQHNGLCLIEAIINSNDYNKYLLEFGSRIMAFNSKPPHYSTLRYLPNG